MPLPLPVLLTERVKLCWVTVNALELVAVPPDVVTPIGPDVAPGGTVA